MSSAEQISHELCFGSDDVLQCRRIMGVTALYQTLPEPRAGSGAFRILLNNWGNAYEFEYQSSETL
jgi:hypothetical protein